ncbi:hypothetical protein HBI12_239080 [Parastagonospora nodorum]|nr:hypothetical protein HBI12_239080 [Parastagonospora nodorum]
MCAKDDLEVLFQTHNRRLAEELATAESITAKDSNHVDTFSLDFAFSPPIARGNVSNANILSLIAFIISYCLFADELNIQQSLLDRATVVLIIILVDKTQLLLILGDVAAYTLLARFIPTTKIRDPLLKTLENAAKSGILLTLLLTSVKKNRHYMRCTKHYNFNIHVSLATDTLHLLLKGLVMKMLDFMQDMLNDIYPSKQKAIIQQLIAIVSPLFISKAPFALHFIRAVCDLFYSITNKKEYILQICLHNSQRTALLAANYATIVKQRIQPYSTKLPLSEVAANIAISNFIYAAAVFQFSSKRHNDPKHCNKEVLYLILTIINYTCYDKDRKHIAYIRAFSKVLLFNNNRQINNTTRMLSILQAFKFYDLSTIIRLVHLVLRDLPNLTTYTTMSYYVNNYID